MAKEQIRMIPVKRDTGDIGTVKLVLQGCVSWADENNCKLITSKEMQIINDKRSKEKNKK